MIVYDHDNAFHGLMLAQWWAQLYATGDLAKVFPTKAQCPQALYRLMEPPMVLYLDYDDSGIWFAAWVSPTLTTAFFSLWVAERRRQAPTAHKNLMRVYELTFERYETILGLTKQEGLLEQHTKLGYKIGHKLPGVWDGEPAWLVSLTREDYYGHRSAAPRRQRRQHGGTNRTERSVSTTDEGDRTSTAGAVRPDSRGPADRRHPSENPFDPSRTGAIQVRPVKCPTAA